MDLHDFAWFATGIAIAHVPSLIFLAVAICHAPGLREDAETPRDELDEIVDRVAVEMARRP